MTVTGPRQSGKSTLCRHVFPDKPYINLEARGPEADVLVEVGATMYAIECKSGATLASEWFAATEAAATLITEAGESAKVEPIVVYGGEESREGTRRAVGWRRLGDEGRGEVWMDPPPSLG